MASIKARLSPSTLYEDYYIDPTSVQIAGSGKISYMYMEGMETTYVSQAAGGQQLQKDYIPNLTILAWENFPFSNTERLGSFALSGALGVRSLPFSPAQPPRKPNMFLRITTTAEDMYLYEIAKGALLFLPQSDKPFNLPMLAADTHHVGRYICPL